MKRTTPYIYIAVTVCLLWACSSHKTVQKSGKNAASAATGTATGTVRGEENVAGTASGSTAMAEVKGWQMKSTALRSIDAKAQYTLQLAGKSAKTVNGRFTVIRAQGIQLSVAPFLGIEVGRMNITPQGLTVIDHLHSRYVTVDFTELSEQLHTQLDYHSLQALFLGEVFLYGYGEDFIPLTSFITTQEKNQPLLTATAEQKIDYSFLLSADEAQVERTQIAINGKPYLMQWFYEEFMRQGSTTYPSHLKVKATDGSKSGELLISLSKTQVNRVNTLDLSIPKGYEAMKLEDVLTLFHARS